VQLIVGGILVVVSLIMLLGYFNADLSGSAGSAVMALVIAVGIPGVAGVALLTRHFKRVGGYADRRAQLKRQTQEAELLRMAGEHGGRLTVVEVVRELAMAQPEAEALMKSMVERCIADIEITDSGLLVYAFPDVQRLDDKSSSRGVLDD
jgi:hypothetical protein